MPGSFLAVMAEQILFTGCTFTMQECSTGFYVVILFEIAIGQVNCAHDCRLLLNEIPKSMSGLFLMRCREMTIIEKREIYSI